eukprot:s255_g3.t1
MGGTWFFRVDSLSIPIPAFWWMFWSTAQQQIHASEIFAKRQTKKCPAGVQSFNLAAAPIDSGQTKPCRWQDADVSACEFAATYNMLQRNSKSPKKPLRVSTRCAKAPFFFKIRLDLDPLYPR